MIRGPPTANDFLRKRGGRLVENVFADEKLPFVSGVSGEIDLRLLIRLLFEEISNYYTPHDCRCWGVQNACFLTDSCNNTTFNIMRLIDVNLHCLFRIPAQVMVFALHCLRSWYSSNIVLLME